MTVERSAKGGSRLVARAAGFRTAPGLGRTRELVTFEWEEAGLLCLLGPNGSGKTTLLAALARSRAGRQVEHLEWQQTFLQGQATYLPTESVVSLRLRPLDYLRIIAPGHRPDQEDQQLVSATRTFKSMSRGEIRRWEVALTCLSDADCLFLDEPERSIDRASETWIAAMLRHAVQQGKLVVTSSHSEEIAAQATLVVEL